MDEFLDHTAVQFKFATGAARRASVALGVPGGSSGALDEQGHLDAAHPPVPADRVGELVRPLAKQMQGLGFYRMMGMSTQVIAVDLDSPLALAFIAAQESRVSSVMLWDAVKAEFVGLLTVADYIRVLLHSDRSPEQADDIAAVSVRDARQQPWMCPRGPQHASLVAVGPDASVWDCLVTMVDNYVNRLPVLGHRALEPEAEDEEADEDGGFGILSVVTFPLLLDHVARVLFHTGQLGGGVGLGTPTSGDKAGFPELPYATLFDVPLCALPGLGRYITGARDGRIPKLAPDTNVGVALEALLSCSVHALCVTDPTTGAVVDVISRSDVLRLESGGGYDMRQSIQDALSFRSARGTVVVCTPQDTLGDIVAHFIGTWVKELFVVDPSAGNAVVGQLSLKELMRYIRQHGADATA